MKLKSLVIFTNQLEEMRKFYSALGFNFQEERHGKGPKHFSCQLGPLLLEFYPSDDVSDNKVRMEFEVEDLGVTKEKFCKEFWLPKSQPFYDEDNCLRIMDPSGNKIILTQA